MGEIDVRFSDQASRVPQTQDFARLAAIQVALPKGLREGIDQHLEFLAQTGKINHLETVGGWPIWEGLDDVAARLSNRNLISFSGRRSVEPSSFPASR